MEFVDSLQDEYFYLSEIFSQLKKDGSTGPTALESDVSHILKSWDNDSGAP